MALGRNACLTERHNSASELSTRTGRILQRLKQKHSTNTLAKWSNLHTPCYILNTQGKGSAWRLTAVTYKISSARRTLNTPHRPLSYPLPLCLHPNPLRPPTRQAQSTKATKRTPRYPLLANLRNSRSTYSSSGETSLQMRSTTEAQPVHWQLTAIQSYLR